MRISSATTSYSNVKSDSKSNMNPFPISDADRHQIWQMLVERDIEAFVAQDWEIVAHDFVEDGFIGIDACRSDNPDTWRVAFPNLKSYRDEWLKQSREMATMRLAADLKESLLAATTLRDIDCGGETALAHKKFDGELKLADGSTIPLRWQTLYQCRKARDVWKISGFVGYLPNPMGGARDVARGATTSAKQLPPYPKAYKKAGPYSPVLQITSGKLVVISGQAAIDPDGNVVGNTIEEQARYSLQNCCDQLASAGCSFADVFKVNVFMTDLADWARFNAVYRAFMSEPYPVRTTVQTGLLQNLLVEIEMWAVMP